MTPRSTKSATAKLAKVKTAEAAAKSSAKAAVKPAAQPAIKAAGTAFKVKDLVGAVAAATGGKKPDVRTAVAATLSALADALARGADLNLPPLGRVRVAKTAGKDGAAVLTLKLRPFNAGKDRPKQTLADDGEDG